VTPEQCHKRWVGFLFFMYLSGPVCFFWDPARYFQARQMRDESPRHSFEGLAPQRWCWRVCRNCRTTEKSSLKVCSAKGLIQRGIQAPISHWRQWKFSA